MATKKVALPEISINTGAIVTLAKEAVEIRSNIAGFQIQEDKTKQSIACEASALRVEEEKKTNYIGLVRVADEASAVRIEFRMDKRAGSLDLADEPVLDKLFGSARPVLFSKETTITGISDPLEIIKELQAKGLDPMSYLSVSIKTGMDKALSELSSNVVTEERLMPQEGFLNTLNNVRNALSADAKTYISVYLENVLKPTVVLGTKGKA